MSYSHRVVNGLRQACPDIRPLMAGVDAYEARTVGWSRALIGQSDRCLLRPRQATACGSAGRGPAESRWGVSTVSSSGAHYGRIDEESRCFRETCHDIRQPIAAVQALAAAALGDPGLQEVTRSYLEQIVTQAQSLAEVIRQRLPHGRACRGEDPPDRPRVSWPTRPPPLSVSPTKARLKSNRTLNPSWFA